jgi:hypothetical protein
MRSFYLALVAAALVFGCSRPSEPSKAHGSAVPTSGPALGQEAAIPLPKVAAKPHGKPGGKPGSASSVEVPVVVEPKLPVAEDADLKLEEQEANPYSETVTLKLSVTPPVKAVVMWGAKQMARLAPGEMEAEITRPRGSGPLDLEIKAEGFMPAHTRLYADRNDRVSVRLYRTEEASGLLGYKRSAADKSTDKKK